MQSKALFAAGVLALCPAVLPAAPSVRLTNPFWEDFGERALVNFSWVVQASTGETGWVEVGGIAVNVPEYVDVEDEECGCPDGYSPPCYRSATKTGNVWESW